jgi:hypothetical protein
MLQFPQRISHRAHIKSASKAQREGAVIFGLLWLELVEKPHPLLGGREWKRPGALRAWNRIRLLVLTGQAIPQQFLEVIRKSRNTILPR